MTDPVVAAPVETAAVTTNGNQTIPLPPAQGSASEVFALFKADTSLMVWLVFLALGGGILALYYARIRYLPDIEWSSALIYLGAATIIGGGLGLLFAMSLFLPGFIWSESLIFDPKLEKQFCYDTKNKEICVGTIFHYLGKPFGAALLLSHLSLLIGQYVDSLKVLLIVYTVISLILLGLIRPYMRDTFTDLESRLPDGTKPAESERDASDEEKREVERWKLKCVSWFSLSLVLSQVSVLTMYVLSKPKDLFSFFALTLICTAGVLLSNHVVAILYHHHARQAILASLVAAGFLLLTADWFSPLSLRIMGYYGLGGDRKGDLVISDDGAKVIGDLGLSLCKTRTLCNVEILSKLGDEYYLVVDGKTFTLPKSMVQSYESSDPRSTK